MIYTHRNLTRDADLSCDVCIVGSGAGGAAAAYSLARSGSSVIVLETGSFLTPAQFNQREDSMYPRLFFESGGRRTEDRAIRILHGKGVGGSTLHNINLCKRVPDELLAEWDLPALLSAAFRARLDEVERLLDVSPIEERQVNRCNQLIRAGMRKLGYRGGLLRHNRKGCAESGYCELGCAYDAKMNAARVLIPAAVRAGARVLADTRAIRVNWSGRRATGVLAESRLPGTELRLARVRIRARAVISAAGAIETPALLQRSQVPETAARIGSRLRIHPGAAVAGRFDEKVESWLGIPQSVECTELLSFERGSRRRVWIVAGAAHPAGAAALMPGFGAAHAALMADYPRLAPLSAMVHDLGSGSVRADGPERVRISYQLSEDDRDQLALGLRECARILLAAGARDVLVPAVAGPIVVRTPSEADRLSPPLEGGGMEVVSVHPMGTVWMGRDPATSCLDERGRLHRLDNLFVADASVYPTSLGVPPQITTYAVGLHVGASVLEWLA